MFAREALALEKEGAAEATVIEDKAVAEARGLEAKAVALEKEDPDRRRGEGVALEKRWEKENWPNPKL